MGLGFCVYGFRVLPDVEAKAMKLTPLLGCAMLEICGLRVLLECPIGTSALLHFLPAGAPVVSDVKTGRKRTAPTPNAQNKKPKSSGSSTVPSPLKNVEGRIFVEAEPWYRTPAFSLMNLPELNVVIVSNPSSMLGLPFITSDPDFNGMVFATDAAATLGNLLLQELVHSHRDYIQVDRSQSQPPWMSDDLTSSPPPELKLLADSDWHQLYSAADVESCMKKVRRLRYGEVVALADCVTLTPSSSGFSVGAANWVLKGPWASLTYISESSSRTAHAAALDLRSLEGPQVLLVSPTGSLEKHQIETKQESSKPAGSPFPSRRPWVTAPVKFITSQSRGQLSGDLIPPTADPDVEKSPAQQIGKFVVEAVSKGGSVLFPTNVSDGLLEIFETLSSQLSSANMGHVPIFVVSPCAEEFLAFANIVPEWLSPARQEKLYAGEPSFGHVELQKAKRLCHFASLSSPGIVEAWREPCVVFAAHASLRMGPAVTLLHRWRHRPECLLVYTETGYDVELALHPFKPVSMQILKCPTAASLSATDVESIFQRLQPKIALLPETLRPTTTNCSTETQHLFYSSQAVDVDEPDVEVSIELSSELAARIKPKQVKSSSEGLAVGRLTGELHFLDGRFYLEHPAAVPLSLKSSSSSKQRYYGGGLRAEAVVKALKDRGLDDARIVVADGSSSTSSSSGKEQDKLLAVISMRLPSSATVELRSTATSIKADDPVLRRLVTDAVASLLQGL